MSKKIQVKISKDGKVKIEYDGYVGAACHEAAENLKSHLKRLGVGSTGESVQEKETFITDDPMQLNKQYN